MALLDLLTPRFAVERSEAPEVLAKMVRVFFAPSVRAGALRTVEEVLARGGRYGRVEGEVGDTYDGRPASISWKPFEKAPDFLHVEVITWQYGNHMVDIVAMEKNLGRKVQPFPHGFRLERPMDRTRFRSTLEEVLGHPVELEQHLVQVAKTRLCLELFGHSGGKDAPGYNAWITESLPKELLQRLRAAHRFIWARRRADEIIRQISLDRPGLLGGVASLLQEGAGLPSAEALQLAVQLLERFPTDLDWQVGVYAPLRIPIEHDMLEVDYACPLGVRSGVPSIPADSQILRAEILLQPDTASPWVEGLYDHQCLVLDAVDAIRGAFGLPPDARYVHYRENARRD